jgi:hypothetical protein
MYQLTEGIGFALPIDYAYEASSGLVAAPEGAGRGFGVRSREALAQERAVLDEFASKRCAVDGARIFDSAADQV